MFGALLEVEMLKLKKCAKHISKSKCAKHTLLPEHFWKFTRHCGAKQMSKSTCQKTPQVRNAFGDWDVEKVRTIVARSTLPSPNVKTPHAWSIFGSWDVENGKQISKSKCEQNQMFGPLKKGCDAGKSSRRCNGKQNSKWKWQKHHMLGPLLEVERSTECTLLWFHLWTMRFPFYTTLHHASPHYTTIATTTAIIIITLQLQLQLQL